MHIDIRNAEIDDSGRIRHSVIREAGTVGARFVQPRRRECVNKDDGCRGVKRLEGNVRLRTRTGRAADAVVVQLGKVDASGKVVLRRQLIVDAPVELVAAAVGRNIKLRILNIGNVIQAAAELRIRRENSNLRSATGSERADIQAAGDNVAIDAHGQACATRSQDGANPWRHAWVGQNCSAHSTGTVGHNGGAILRGLNVGRGLRVVGRGEGSPGSKDEKLLVDQRSAERTCPTPLIVIHNCGEGA